MKNNLVSLSIFCLAICFLIGSWLITNGINSVLKTPKNQQIQHQLLTQNELADYLGLSEEDIQKLGPVYEGEGVTTTEIPYLKIGDKTYYSKRAIDEWLQSQDSLSVE